MNHKKIVLSLFSLLAMIALTAASFAPAHAAPADAWSPAVTASLKFDPVTRTLVAVARFTDPAIQLGYGIGKVYLPMEIYPIKVLKTVKQSNVRALRVTYKVPAGPGRYCVRMTLYGVPAPQPSAPYNSDVMPYQSAVVRCISVSK